LTAAAASLLAELRARGIHLAAVAGGAINVKAPAGAITADDRRRIADCKPDLLRLLRREAAAIPDVPAPDLVILDATLAAFDGLGLRCTGIIPRAPGAAHPGDTAPWGFRCDRQPERPRPTGPAPAPSAGMAAATEEARTVYLTRLGVAMDLEIPADVGTPAELVAWREAMGAMGAVMGVVGEVSAAAAAPGQSSPAPAEPAGGATRDLAVDRPLE
jgi:hypothetical protein